MLNYKIANLKEALLETADEITKTKIKVAENINNEFEAMKALKILADLKSIWDHLFNRIPNPPDKPNPS